jgi:ubiquitin-protein ligase E3 C
MGDDEFFSSAAGPARGSGGASVSGNPLSIDELISFSRQLLNIAFPLYWHEDQTNIKETDVPGLGIKWEGVRDRVTRCLQAIHARE